MNFFLHSDRYYLQFYIYFSAHSYLLSNVMTAEVSTRTGTAHLEK